MAEEEIFGSNLKEDLTQAMVSVHLSVAPHLRELHGLPTVVTTANINTRAIPGRRPACQSAGAQFKPACLARARAL